MWRSVNFGSTHTGLATVGYRLRSAAGTLGSRITAGVSEVVAGSGMYGAVVDESANPVEILWDISAGSTVVAAEGLIARADVVLVLGEVPDTPAVVDATLVPTGLGSVMAESGLDAREALSLIVAAMFGEVTKDAVTGVHTFKDPTGSSTRITGIAPSGARDNITLTPYGG